MVPSPYNQERLALEHRQQLLQEAEHERKLADIDAGVELHEAHRHHTDERREPRPAAEVADEPAAVREPEVAVAAGSEHRDVDVPGEPPDEVGDEPAGEVALVPRVRGGEVDDAEPLFAGERGKDGRDADHPETHRQRGERA